MRHEAAKKNVTPRKNAQVPSESASASTVPARTGQPNEGEGNRTAARRYDTATESYVASGRAPQAAKAAADALDGPEGDELRKAEKFGKEGHPKRKAP